VKTRLNVAAALTCVAAVALVAGCATAVIPASVRSQVSEGITFQQVRGNPEAYRGKTVLWAGHVLALRNEKEGTYVEVLQAPADAEGRPHSFEQSAGRFIAFFDRYLDEAVYRPGRSVTVVGVVQGQKSQPLGQGKTEYAYPLLTGQYIYLWPPMTRRPPPYYNEWGPWWGDPWWPDYYYEPTVILPRGHFEHEEHESPAFEQQERMEHHGLRR